MRETEQKDHSLFYAINLLKIGVDSFNLNDSIERILKIVLFYRMVLLRNNIP